MGRGRPAAAGLLSLKTGIAPVYRSDARVLILGSLPGDASIATARYYAHPRNQFWHLLGNVIGVCLIEMEYNKRIEAIKNSGVALWDVIGEAHRPGSLDQKIRDVQLNDLSAFTHKLPNLRAVAFNGRKASDLARKVFATAAPHILILPSSSPANTQNFDAKLVHWAAISDHLNGQIERPRG